MANSTAVVAIESTNTASQFDNTVNLEIESAEQIGWTVRSVSFHHTYDQHEMMILRTAYIVYDVPADEDEEGDGDA